MKRKKERASSAPAASGKTESGASTVSNPAPRKRRRKGTGALEDRIGYRFEDADLLDCALTHISALTGPLNRVGSYQRLEFLGDHVLGLVISDMLFRNFPKANEGELSRRLADLVRKETCAEMARELDLGAIIRLGSSEAGSGGRSRDAILADVCESLIGAVFLDGGYPAAATFVERIWSERMRTPVRPLRDPKTTLQEWAQGRGLPLPAYEIVSREGPDHAPCFTVAVSIEGYEAETAEGRSKQEAEKAAALVMLLKREGAQ